MTRRIDAMVQIVRTTINIDPEILRELKERAARTGRTIGSLIEDAVRSAAKASDEDRASLRPLPTFGGSGTLPGIDLTSRASLHEAMDEGEPFDALR